MRDGYALIRALRALDDVPMARIPAIALTAYGRVEDRLKTLSAGYNMHVPKPVDPAELGIVVASLARRAGGQPPARARRSREIGSPGRAPARGRRAGPGSRPP